MLNFNIEACSIYAYDQLTNASTRVCCDMYIITVLLSLLLEEKPAQQTSSRIQASPSVSTQVWRDGWFCSAKRFAGAWSSCLKKSVPYQLQTTRTSKWLQWEIISWDCIHQYFIDAVALSSSHTRGAAGFHTESNSSLFRVFSELINQELWNRSA